MDLGIYSVSRIRDQVSRIVQKNTPSFLTSLVDELNDQYFRLVQARDWHQLRDIHQDDISWTSGTPRFYCPRDVFEPIALLDNTNNQFLESYRLDEILYAAPSWFDTSGSVMKWATIADACKQRDFSGSAENIKIVSSTSADTSKTIRFVYLDSNSVEQSETIITNSSNGATEVNSVASMKDLVSISTNSIRSGVITVSGVTSLNVYARLGPLESSVFHKVLYLSRTPSSANLGVLVYKKAVSRLVNDDDIPRIPIGPYLVKYLTAWGYQFLGRTDLYQTHRAEAEQIESSILKSSSTSDSGGTIQSMPRIAPKFSRYRW